MTVLFVGLNDDVARYLRKRVRLGAPAIVDHASSPDLISHCYYDVVVIDMTGDNRDLGYRIATFVAEIDPKAEIIVIDGFAAGYLAADFDRRTVKAPVHLREAPALIDCLIAQAQAALLS